MSKHTSGVDFAQSIKMSGSFSFMIFFYDFAFFESITLKMIETISQMESENNHDLFIFTYKEMVRLLGPKFP